MSPCWVGGEALRSLCVRTTIRAPYSATHSSFPSRRGTRPREGSDHRLLPREDQPHQGLEIPCGPYRPTHCLAAAAQPTYWRVEPLQELRPGVLRRRRGVPGAAGGYSPPCSPYCTMHQMGLVCAVTFAVVACGFRMAWGRGPFPRGC